jgi:hypothetical protein
MKSPVYGANAGNINLHGKKCRKMDCGCCWMYDLRDNEAYRVARAEMAVATTDAALRSVIDDEELLKSELDNGDETDADWIEYNIPA